jgi:transcriptional antiterminator RfaH
LFSGGLQGGTRPNIIETDAEDCYENTNDAYNVRRQRRPLFFNDCGQLDSVCIRLFRLLASISIMANHLSFSPPPRLAETQPGDPVWYCVRTKAKHEHIAAATLRKTLDLEVFHPRLRVERATQRGVVRVVEPLFPCYIFVRCVLEEKLNEIQHTSGVGGLVRFGERIPQVADSRIEELQECFMAEEPMMVESSLAPADEVTIADGVFAGIQAFVLRVMPARKRVQVLLDVLGRPTPVEVDRESVVLEKRSLADLAPILAATVRTKAAALN